MASVDELRKRYTALLHGVQTGIAHSMEYDGFPQQGPETPKHLRVGVNSALIEFGALVGLLLRKKVITEQEFWEAMVQAAQDEVDRYEQILSDQYGVTVHLG